MISPLAGQISLGLGSVSLIGSCGHCSTELSHIGLCEISAGDNKLDRLTISCSQDEKLGTSAVILSRCYVDQQYGPTLSS